MNINNPKASESSNLQLLDLIHKAKDLVYRGQCYEASNASLRATLRRFIGVQHPPDYQPEHDAEVWRRVAKGAGVCMTCAISPPEPIGCTDCLNTGWVGGCPQGFIPEPKP